MKKFAALILAIVLLASALTECGGSTKSSMKDDELVYVATRMRWQNKGNKLVVEGSFYNFSDTCDVTGIQEPMLYLLDGNGNVILDVNAKIVTKATIPHNGRIPFNFTSKKIHADEYDLDELSIVTKCNFSYVSCEGEDCKYCQKVQRANEKSVQRNSTEKTVCTSCNGTGLSKSKCTWCGGSGVDPTYLSTKGSVMHSFTQKSCAKCGGSGYSKCNACWGRGTN